MSLLKTRNEATLNQWHEQEKIALELLRIVGELRFDSSVELLLFRKDIYDTRPSELINHHLVGKHYSTHPIDVALSLQLAKAIASIKELAPSRIDLGKLAAQWLETKSQYTSINDFVIDKLNDHIGFDKKVITPKDIVLYGFGRIGRLAARRIVAQTGQGQQLRLKAIVLRPKLSDTTEELKKRASLLRVDSVHGVFPGVVEVDGDNCELIINGNRVKVIFASRPTDIDYTKYGIKDAMIIDNTGVWRDKAALSQHLQPGISHVMLTAPGKDIKNIVHGINQKELIFNEDRVFSAASCTTNAITPILKVINDTYGIEKGHIETIHAYTNDQNLIDNFHKKPRRGRGAPINMVLTSTGAAKAVSKAIPELEGKLTGNAVRIPTPNVSLAILNLTLGTSTDVDTVNRLIKDASLFGKLVEQIHYSEDKEYVSSDAVGTTSTSVFDAPSTLVSQDGKSITLYVWYDNEFGYTCQVVRLAKYVSQVRRLRYY